MSAFWDITIMQELPGGWRVEIDHAREWLCMQLFEPFLQTPVQQLAEQIRRLLDREFARNLVLEMDHVIHLNGRLMRQLQLLDEHLSYQGGELRLSGLSDECYEAVERTKMEARFPRFHTRQQALTGHNPGHPR
ncbi:MAG: STAS domain-containing protein [Planctomycetota bacterium]|jgi:anti-anti-sigma regulatory factor|nr:STAS domain-containing protein [Planctomycetota bacterium]MEE2990114.1 STAS domain-containing protein [Planctomycetota bacterium]